FLPSTFNCCRSAISSLANALNSCSGRGMKKGARGFPQQPATRRLRQKGKLLADAIDHAAVRRIRGSAMSRIERAPHQVIGAEPIDERLEQRPRRRGAAPGGVNVVERKREVD